MTEPTLNEKIEAVLAEFAANPKWTARQLVELRERSAKHRAQVDHVEMQWHETLDALAAEKQKRLPPADQLRDVRAERAELDSREDEFNRRVDEFEAQGRRSRRHRLDDQAAALRVAAIRELKALIPMAKKQARAGKPALLRLILRSAR